MPHVNAISSKSYFGRKNYPDIFDMLASSGMYHIQLPKVVGFTFLSLQHSVYYLLVVCSLRKKYNIHVDTGIVDLTL